MTLTLANAAEIAQAHLDGIAASINECSFAGFSARIDLPFHVLTYSTHQVIDTVDGLFEIYDAMTRTIAHQGGTQYLRVAKAVTIEDDGTLLVNDETNVLRGGQRLISPFLGRVTLKNVEDHGWKETHAAYAITHTTWPILVPDVDMRPNFPEWPDDNGSDVTQEAIHAKN